MVVGIMVEKRILSDKGARSSGARATLNRHSSNIQDQLANAIARQIDKTTLTHLDIGLLGLGARGLLAIANALIKGSGVRDVERVLAKHHIALSKFEKREQNVEIELARRQEKLAQVKAFVQDRREKAVHGNDVAKDKRYAMTSELKRKAGRKTVSDTILKDRLAVAEAAKAAYAHRPAGRTATSFESGST